MKHYYVLTGCVSFFLFTGMFAGIQYWVDRIRENGNRVFYTDSTDEEIITINSFTSTSVCLTETTITTQLFDRTVNKDLKPDQIQELWVVVEDSGNLVHQRVARKSIPITTREDVLALPYNLTQWNLDGIESWIQQGYNTFFWKKRYFFPYEREVVVSSESFNIYSDCK